MQPILSTIFDISKLQAIFCGCTGGCTALFISDPVATQITGFLVTSSNKQRKKKKTTFDLCFTVRGLLFKFVDFLYSRSEVFDRVVIVISSENVFFSLSFDV